MEKYRKSFSHNLYESRRREISQWIRAIRLHDQPEDDERLRWCGIQWFTVLGHCPMYDRESRQTISGRLTVIERQRARNKAKSN